MAYNGYRSTPNPYQTGNMTSDQNDPYGPPNPPYPSRHETDHLNMPQPQMPPSTSSTQNMEPYPAPPRPESTQSGHFHDAVSSAVNSSESTSYLSPDVLQQITATVIQQLKANGLDNTNNLPGSSGPPPARSQSLQPPYIAADVAPRPHSESPPIASQRSGSVPFVDPMSKSYDTQPYVPPSASSSDFPPHQTAETSSRRRESMSSQGSQRGEARPRPPERDTTAMEMTTLERIWGKLFEDGKPTKRLSQFLRGIAMHLVCFDRSLSGRNIGLVLTLANRLKITHPVIRWSLPRTRCRNSMRMLMFLWTNIPGKVCLFSNRARQGRKSN